MSMSIIPGVVDEQEVRTLRAGDSAHAAARTMIEHDISAVIVVDDAGSLVGIVTERDLSRRVVAENLAGADVKLEAIMTADPTAAAPGDTAAATLTTMHRLRVRHMPVVDHGKVVGIVSIRDLQSTVSRQVVAF